MRNIVKGDDVSKVLLAGESWVSDVTDHKGFDPFPHTQVHIGCEKLLEVLRNNGHEVTHLKSHDVSTNFPFSIDELNEYDVVILSDVGANSLLLPPQVFEEGKKTPNRLKVIRDWVRQGGGLLMAGGYLSFQGFQAKANYAGSPVEEALPVSIFHWDDRVETPEGARPQLSATAHTITEDLDEDWPDLLGYQLLTPKDGSEVLATINDDPLLITTDFGEGRSAAFASDISPHWVPEEFMAWNGYGKLFNNIINWLS